MEITWRFIIREGEEGEWGKKVQGIRSIIDWQKPDRGRVIIVKEMKTPKNLYV